MPASMRVGHGEAKAMATKQKASRAITKKDLLSRLLHCSRNYHVFFFFFFFFFFLFCFFFVFFFLRNARNCAKRKYKKYDKTK